MSYQTSVTEKGVSVTAFEGVEAVTDVLELHPLCRWNICCGGKGATEDKCIIWEYCMYRFLYRKRCSSSYDYVQYPWKKKISLTGGTGDGGKVSVNGTVYTDADVFAFVKNNGGKVRVYKENIYYPNPQYRFIASKTDRSKYTVGELNGKPARQAYQDTLGIREQDIVNQTFKNPLGKKNGKDICIISIREVARKWSVLLSPGQWFRCTLSAWDKWLSFYCRRNSATDQRRFRKNFRYFFHKLYFPLSVLLPGTLYGSVFKNNGNTWHACESGWLWRTLQQPVCKPDHVLCGIWVGGSADVSIQKQVKETKEQVLQTEEKLNLHPLIHVSDSLAWLP